MAAKEYLISDGPIMNFIFRKTFFNPNPSLTLMRPTNPSLTYSATYFDQSFIVVVDSLLMWTLTAAVAEDRVTLSHDSERKRTIYVY